MRNFKMIVEYDGSAYHGWQKQKNGISIQHVLEEAIKKITGQKVSVIGSGRTDAGVHAFNQVASFRCATKLPVDRLYLGINSVLPDDIVVKSLEEVDLDFHAQRDVKSKVYVYKIRNQKLRPALERSYCWFVRFDLDLEKMRRAAKELIGTHDFSCFCATGTDVQDRVRTILNIDVKNNAEGRIEIWIEAQGFLKYMVRNIVGTLVDVGRGKIRPEEMKDIVATRDRKRAGVTAPAQGLFLQEVKY